MPRWTLTTTLDQRLDVVERSSVADVRFNFLHQFRGHLPNTMLLGTLCGVLEDFGFRLTTNHVLAAA